MPPKERAEIFPVFLAKEIEKIQNNPELKKELCTKITDFLHLIKSIWSLSSKEYQKRFWVNKEQPISDDSFRQSTALFFSTAREALQAHENKQVTMTSDQHQSLERLYRTVEKYVEKNAAGKSDADVVKDPMWQKIQADAKLVYEELTGEKLS